MRKNRVEYFCNEGGLWSYQFMKNFEYIFIFL